MKARIKYYSKIEIQNRYVVELSIHEIAKSPQYINGVRFGLICKDLHTSDFVLIDNHYPKGPHIHINEREADYEYVDDDKLIEDFKVLVFEQLGVKL